MESYERSRGISFFLLKGKYLVNPFSNNQFKMAGS